MTLNKRYRRNIKENLSFYISSAILTCITLIMFYLFSIGGRSIADYRDSFFERNNIESANFETYVDIPDSDIKTLEEKYNIVLDVQKYYNSNDNKFSDGKTFKTRIFNQNKKINTYEIVDGTTITNDNEIIVSKGFADNMNYGVGKKLTINNKEYTIVGTFLRPDYLYMLENPSSAYKNITDFFLCYMSDSEIEKLDAHNLYMVKYNNDTNIDEFRKEIYDKYQTRSYLDADSNFRIHFMYSQTVMFVTMSYVLLCTLPFFAVLILVLILARRIKKEQKIIGSLKALGYSRGRIVFHYSIMALIPGLIGGLLTVILSAIFAQPYGSMCLSDYEPIQVNFKLYPLDSVLGVIIPTLIYFISSIITVRLLLRKTTVALLGGRAFQTTKGNKAFYKTNLKTGTKYSIRSLLINKGRSIVLFLGIVMGAFIMSMGLFCFDTMKGFPNVVAKEQGDFKYEYFLNKLETNNPYTGTEELLAIELEMKNSTLTTVSLMGYDKSDNPLINTKTTDGTLADLDNGYYISKYMSKSMKIKKGDSITIREMASLKEREIKVAGVIDIGSMNFVMTSKKNMINLIDSPYITEENYNILLSSEKLDIDSTKIAQIVTKDDIKQQSETVIDEMGPLIYIMIIIGAIIMIVSIYVVMEMIIREETSNISMLKVLGYSKHEVNKMVLSSNHIILPFGILFGIILGYLLVDFFFGYLSSEETILFKTITNPSSYFITIGLVLLSYIISLWLLRNKAEKVSMIDSLKDCR